MRDNVLGNQLWTTYENLTPRSGLKPVSPALAGGFLMTGPPGEPETVAQPSCFPYQTAEA